jgi:hypothetical protein
MSYLLPVAIFLVTLVVIVVWERMQHRLSDEQLEALSGSPLLRFLGYLLFAILIAGLAMKIAHDLGW